MSDPIIHKAIQPTPKTGTLKDLILCWSEISDDVFNGLPFEPIASVKYTTNLNDATCPACIEIWKEVGVRNVR